MRIFNYATIRGFWEAHADSKEPLIYWYTMTEAATWKNPVDVKTTFRSADIISDDRVVFNIKGNSYRLIASLNYEYQSLFIKFIGTHKEYDKVNAATVDFHGGGGK